MKDVRHQFSVGHVINPQPFGHDLSSCTVITFQELLEQTPSSSAIALLLKKNINTLSILIYSAPQIVMNAIYLDGNLVEIKRISEAFGLFSELPSRFSNQNAPILNRFIANDNFSFS